MKVVVTGSTGFLGKEICKQLREKKYEVKEFSRSQGFDLLKKEDCEKACEKADYVVHSAAIISEREKNIMEAVNVQGTKNILEAAAKARVKHMVYVSTTGVYGKTKGEINENSNIKPETDYEKTKAEAEEVVWSYQEAIHITIVRPPIIFGKNRTWTKIGKIQWLPLPGNGKNIFQTAYVKDVADAIIFLLGKEEAFSEKFIVAGKEKPSFEEFVKEIRHEIGLNEKVLKVPLSIAISGSYLMDAVSKLLGKYNPYSQENIKRLASDRTYSIEKIKNIGWNPKYSYQKAIHEVFGEIK